MDELYEINDLLSTLGARENFPEGEEGDEEYDEALNEATHQVAQLLRITQ